VAESRARSSFVVTLLVGGLGAAIAAVAAHQTWMRAHGKTPGLPEVTASGSDVAPVVLPLALVALAAWGTVLVLRVTGRRIVAVIGLVASVAASVVVLTHVGDAHGTGWPVVAGVGAVLSAAGFGVVLARAQRWPEMSRRYDAPTDQQAQTNNDLWKALDEGRDPTV
jgi:hypothetical protein